MLYPISEVRNFVSQLNHPEGLAVAMDGSVHAGGEASEVIEHKKRVCDVDDQVHREKKVTPRLRQHLDRVRDQENRGRAWRSVVSPAAGLMSRLLRWSQLSLPPGDWRTR